jgi:hypothetical protein
MIYGYKVDTGYIIKCVIHTLLLLEEEGCPGV